jgi:hypothetical protein
MQPRLSPSRVPPDAALRALNDDVDSSGPEAGLLDLVKIRASQIEEDLVELTVAIGVINTWNRLAIGFRYIHPVDAPKAA